ncbi:PaeR7I family type II restriction endonuclease [Saliphagus infecundisoli]|uniref:PaeR7I family type II restriction endonuclease n=1 Tax=Saliphagus infecundisoli TaxID=1849069 RepID=A0ABD5QNL3_9EURY|nr:PaeR7I family type II restriction endonuclease [Saliphagus infecundisoli]
MIDDLGSEVADAVQWYWETRDGQGAAQRDSEDSTRGRRAEVLGGQQMDGFAGLVEDILRDVGVPADSIKHDYHATLPGYYRHEKEWDTAVVYDDELLAVVEYKSQASSFGNNLNNRAEEAIGNNTDILQAYEEGVFEPSPAPWVGYLMLMADNDDSRSVPGVREPNFDVDDEFKDATYVDRMELLCIRMVRQRLVNNAAFILSDDEVGMEGEYWEPNEELQFRRFARSLTAHVEGQIDIQDSASGSQ